MDKMHRIEFRNYLPFIFAMVILYAVLANAALSFQSIRPGAPLTYALDDAYIHMAIAKNLVQHGVFGITPDGFTSSASSLLWPLLLAGVYRVFGVSDSAPFWMNVVFSTLAMFAGWKMLRRMVGERHWVVFGGLIALALFVPLAPLVISGMEAPLQVALALLLASEAAEQLVCPHPAEWRLALLGALYASTHYESVLLIGLITLLLLFQRRFRLAALLLGASALPFVIFGLVSLSQGWSFMPNSVLVKSAGGAKILNIPLSSISERLSTVFWSQPHLLVMAVAALSGLLIEKKPSTADKIARYLLILFLALLLLHIVLDQFGWYFRYEAYMMAIGLVALCGFWGSRLMSVVPLKAEYLVRAILVGLLTFVAVMPLYIRGITALREMSLAMANIYDQQVQMARFVKAYYSGDCVAVHDIGAIGFYADTCIVDLSGLANREMADAIVQNKPITPVLSHLTENNNVQLIIVNSTWFGTNLPSTWQLVGVWTIDQQITVGDTSVSLYAPSKQQADTIRKNMNDFSKMLPSSVMIKMNNPDGSQSTIK